MPICPSAWLHQHQILESQEIDSNASKLALWASWQRPQAFGDFESLIQQDNTGPLTPVLAMADQDCEWGALDAQANSSLDLQEDIGASVTTVLQTTRPTHSFWRSMISCPQREAGRHAPAQRIRQAMQAAVAHRCSEIQDPASQIHKQFLADFQKSFPATLQKCAEILHPG